MPKQRSKEQIAEGIRNMQKVKEMRAFVKDQFYPLLLTASTSIDDAKFLLGSFSNMVMEQFLVRMKEVKFSELKLEDKLDTKSPQYEHYKKVVELFGDKDVFTTKELIEGMKAEIEMMVNQELKSRKLDTLKTMFYE